MMTRVIQLFALSALSAALACGSPVIPETADVVCDHASIPCGDGNKTVITCTGGAKNLSGTAQFTWKCYHAGANVPDCTYATPPGETQDCMPFEDSYICNADAKRVSVALTCSGKVREQCSLITAQNGQVADPRVDQGRFTIELSPMCSSAPDPSIAIASPSNGSNITVDGTKTYPVSYTTTSWTDVSPADPTGTSCDPKSKSCGHVLLFVDEHACDDPAGQEVCNATGSSPLTANFALCPMAPGFHKLRAELHHNDGSPVIRTMGMGSDIPGTVISDTVVVTVQ